MDCAPDNGGMRWKRIFLWLAALLVTPVVLAALLIAIFGWNWLRTPIENLTHQKTGRVLAIQGDLSLRLAWPAPTLRANAVTFANPPWAREKQMVAADAVEISVDVPQLLIRNVVLPTVHLVHPTVFLEQDAQGKKNWLLDLDQQDESARVHIGQLTLDQGTLGYEDRATKTLLRSSLTTAAATTGNPPPQGPPGVSFSTTGQFHGLPVKAAGSGGPVLALRDERTPYPLTVDATLGRTRIKASGTVTGLTKLSAVDMQLAITGDSLEQLYPLLGIPAPATPAYAMRGRLAHHGNSWRYEAFSGRMGNSDLAGSAQVVTGGTRPQLTAQLTSKVLDLDDLAPVIGKRATDAPPPATTTATPATPKTKGVLPDIPFNADRWTSMDADVGLKAKQIRRATALPLDDLHVQLKLQDAVLTLTPLDFGVAGGHVRANITLDGRSKPIKAKVQAQVRKLLLSKTFPTVALNQASLGEINGAFSLSGSGNSIGGMLATGNGQIALGIAQGEVSQLMMEKAGLHVFEILQLSVAGDRRIKLRCALADFEVKSGVMNIDSLVFDTDVTTLFGSGRVDLARETLDITLNQKTKRTSPLALRSPIHIRGTFAKPNVGVDKGRIAARAAGAVALGLLNPFLALIPLIDPGPGQDSDCSQLMREAKAVPR
ncbi:AsmA family protein [Rhodoferax sp. AJA081-3]|nr:AsmA family protein [Rhodoferax sp. AJA081-3]